jgi:hypothetical protein
MYLSLNIEFFPPLRIYFPFEFGSPRSSFAPPCQAGPTSGSDTTRKPLAPRPSLIPPFRVPPGQKHYSYRFEMLCSGSTSSMAFGLLSVPLVDFVSLRGFHGLVFSKRVLQWRGGRTERHLV